MPTHNLTEAELRETLALVNKHNGNLTAAAREIGVSRNTLWSRRERAKQLPKTTVDPLVKSQMQVSELRRQIADIHKHNESAEKVREELYGLAGLSPSPPKWAIGKSEGGKHAAIPMAFWSDWHFGEVVRKAETGGVNEFNMKIGRERVRRLTAQTIRLAQGFAFAGSVKPPGIVLALGGDMISGDIHEELAETNEAPPLVCVNELFSMLVAAIDELQKAFGKVFVPCVVGNHGRTTKKMRAKEAVYLSYEWNLYTMLERHYANNPNISFFIPGETDAFFRVAGQRFLLTHGNALGVKGGDGIIRALGPIARGAIKLRSSEYKIGREFDFLIMGHWHQEIWLPGVIVNNALKGYDEYARLFLRADPSRPSQCLWFVHPEHGITNRISVYVDEPIVTRENRKWIEIQE